jgi:hypothetical protein
VVGPIDRHKRALVRGRSVASNPARRTLRLYANALLLSTPPRSYLISMLSQPQPKSLELLV